MSTFEAARAHYEPLTEVWVGETADGRERLFVGELNPYILRQDGELSHQPLRRIPVKPRSAEELLNWIWTHPDELNRAMETELADSLGKTVEILEWYPSTPAERAESER